MTDSAGDPAQIITVVFVVAAFVVGLFFRRLSRAAIAGVVLGGIIAAAILYLQFSSGSATADPAYLAGYIVGRVLALTLIGVLMGSLVRRCIGWLFRRRGATSS